MERLLAEPGCLSNGHAAHEPPQKRSVEGMVGISFSNRPVKLPRRKVSATRNFPPGCGRDGDFVSNRKPSDDVASDNISGSLNVGTETPPSLLTETVEPLKDSVLAQSLNLGQDVDLASLNPAQDVDHASLNHAQDVDQVSLNPAQDFDRASLNPAQDIVPATSNTSLGVDPAVLNPVEDVDLARLNPAEGVDLANNLDMSQNADVGSELDMARDVDHANNLDMENCETKELVAQSEIMSSCDTNDFAEPSQIMSNCDTKDVVKPSKQTIANEPSATSNPETIESISELPENEEAKTQERPNLNKFEPAKMSSALEQKALLLTKNLLSTPIPTAVVDAEEEYQEKTIFYKRRLSAIRDFPLYCGRHAPRLSKEEYYEFLAKRRKVTRDSEKPAGECELPINMAKSNVLDGNLEGKIVVQTVDSCRVKIEETSGQDDEIQVVPADENKLDLSGVIITSTVKNEKVVDSSVVAADERELHLSGVMKTGGGQSARVVPKSMVAVVDSELNHSGATKTNRGKRDRVQSSMVTGDYKGNLLSPSKNKNNNVVHYQGEEVNVESLADKVVVLALMAEPNSPWHTEKKNPKLKKNVKFLSSTDRAKVKKEIKESHHLLEWEEDRAKVKKEKMEYHHPLEWEVDEKPVHLGCILPDFAVTVTPFGVPSLETKDDDIDENARKKVRETLRLFQVCCRKLLQEEESKSKDQQTYKRVDLKASSLLKEKSKWVNTGKQILGSVPGVEVGDEFHYRVELAIVGLHRQYMAGIDYLKENGRHLATSIVASGGYNDEIDNSDALIYSGHGGQNASGDKKPQDQKLIRGNLALKNSMEAQTPVRVIRGFKEKASDLNQDAKSKIVATYTYDGLYLVEKYWMEKEHHGGSVFKFQLKRMAGQPELALRIMKKTKKSSVREGLFSDDISDKKERIPISAVNTIDKERPYPFEYTAKVIYPWRYGPEPPKGCDCTKGCSDSETCMCAVKNGGEIPFNHDGAIVEAKPLVYECGPSCKCPPSCPNRVSQRGIKFPLEVFKTESRGWGVRSLISIPSGSFICEYAGVVLQDNEADERTGNDEYLFDIGSNYNDHALWDGLSSVIPDLQTNAICEVVETVGFTIDAAEKGNVGRFINHSCSPNLYAQNVLFDHDDKTLPHIMFFAAENIPPLQELTYHYNYTIDQVRDANGNIKKKPCYCGSHECTGRLY